MPDHVEVQVSSPEPAVGVSTPAGTCPGGDRQPHLARQRGHRGSPGGDLDLHPEGVLLVHGACPRGADAIAAAYADRTPGYRTEEHPTDWHRYGRAAGYRLNAEMIALGADGCAAFIRGGSPGSTSTVRLASAAGIPVWLRTQP
jgi:hypothetical protein